MASAISLGGGFAIGLASSLHCVGMCGGISVLLGFDRRPAGIGATLRGQAILHGGRVASYIMLGAIAGGAGGAIFGQLDASAGYQLMRWAAAVSLAWIGLSTAGLMPVPAFVRDLFAPRRTVMALIHRLPPDMRRLASGLTWGLMPCGMVYGALLFALFSGAATTGAWVMLGFGLGTLPALIVAGFGFARLTALIRSRRAEKMLGIAIALLAPVSLIDSPAMARALCSQLASTFLS